MPQGLQIFDASGNCLLDITDRLTRVLGEVTTGAASGSITNAALTTGTPWYLGANTDGSICSSGEANIVVSFSGSTMSWSYGSGTAVNKSILYGVY